MIPLLAITIIGLSACVHEQSQFLPMQGAETGNEISPYQSVALAGASIPELRGAPEWGNSILLIFNHGSTQEFYADRCDPHTDVPDVIRNLGGRHIGGKRVLVYAFCTPSRTGNYVHQRRAGEPKVIKRARDIEELVAKFRSAGIPSENIFLAGFSAGAWASLLVERRGTAEINGVIAFAPAFAGPLTSRAPGWWDLHRKQSDYLRSAAHMNALVFAFRNDEFSRPDDVRRTLNIPGIDFVPVTPPVGYGADCKSLETHRGAYTQCFEAVGAQQVRAFIERRLATRVQVAALENPSATSHPDFLDPARR